jgi:hypothetical protein
VSSSGHDGAHVGLAGGSRPAGDSESGKHNGRDEEKLKEQDLDLLDLGLEGEREESEVRKNIKDRRRSPDVFRPDSCDSGTGYLPIGMQVRLGLGTRYN